MNSPRNRKKRTIQKITKALTVAAISLSGGTLLIWYTLRGLQIEYERILPFVAELDSQAAELWRLFDGAIAQLLIGLVALAIGTTMLIGWTISRLWRMHTLMKRLREA